MYGAFAYHVCIGTLMCVCKQPVIVSIIVVHVHYVC